MRGIPSKLNARGQSDMAESLEDLIDPHADADNVKPGTQDDADGCIVLNAQDMDALDRQIRITLKDLKAFRFSE